VADFVSFGDRTPSLWVQVHSIIGLGHTCLPLKILSATFKNRVGTRRRARKKIRASDGFGSDLPHAVGLARTILRDSCTVHGRKTEQAVRRPKNNEKAKSVFSELTLRSLPRAKTMEWMG